MSKEVWTHQERAFMAKEKEVAGPEEYVVCPRKRDGKNTAGAEWESWRN